MPGPVFAKVPAVGTQRLGAPGRTGRVVAALLTVATAGALTGGCSSGARPAAAGNPEASQAAASSPASPGPRPSSTPLNVYAHIGVGMMNPRWAADPYRIYVPNSLSNTVTEINPHTYKIIRTFGVGGQPNHITPSWDGSVLWVNNTDGYSLTPISPKTGRPVQPVLHPGRPERDGDGRGAGPDRLPQPAHHAAALFDARAVCRGEPHGLHRRRAVRGG